MLLPLIILLSLTKICVGFPTGAPLNSCVNDMSLAIPPYAHLTSPKVYNVTTTYQPISTTGGFIYNYSDTAWQANVPFTISITNTLPVGTRRATIRGYMYQAFDAAGNRVGTWTASPSLFNNSVPASQNVLCPNGYYITHTAAIANGAATLRPMQLNLTVLITTPGIGPIFISGITLTDRTVYWQVNFPLFPERTNSASVTPTPVPIAPQLAITPSTLALHNSSSVCTGINCPPSSCWIGLYGNVFNVTDWAHYHPGDTPGGSLQAYCGTDATAAYNAVPTHDMHRIGLYSYYLGPLSSYDYTQLNLTTPTFPPTAPNTVLNINTVSTYNGQNGKACWTVINNKVYDMSQWVLIHPGGSLIDLACGVDGTALFASTPLHNAALLPYQTKLLGNLVGPSTAAPTTPSTSAPTTTLPPTSPLLTMSLVAQHNTASSCYVVISNNVYDVTAYIPNHPGGTIITAACGTEATTLYQTSTTLHVPSRLSVLTTLLGPLVTLPPTTLPAPTTAAPTTATPTTAAPTTAAPTTATPTTATPTTVTPTTVTPTTAAPTTVTPTTALPTTVAPTTAIPTTVTPTTVTPTTPAPTTVVPTTATPTTVIPTSTVTPTTVSPTTVTPTTTATPTTSPACPAAYPYLCTNNWGSSVCFNKPANANACIGPLNSWCALPNAPTTITSFVASGWGLLCSNSAVTACPSSFPFLCQANWGASVCFNDPDAANNCNGAVNSWCALPNAPSQITNFVTQGYGVTCATAASSGCPKSFPFLCTGAFNSKVCYNNAQAATACNGPVGSWCGLSGAPSVISNFITQGFGGNCPAQ